MSTPVLSFVVDDTIRRLRRILEALGADVEHALIVEVDGPPKSKARPRFQKSGKTYADPTNLADEHRLGHELKQYVGKPYDGNLCVVCIFYRQNQQRIDVDNLLKHVMDSANHIMWHDDSQVTAKAGILELDTHAPRTLIAVAPHTSTMIRTGKAGIDRVCPTCGKRFWSEQPRAVFCSRRCSSLSSGADLRAHETCARCGNAFKRRTARQRFCSDVCRLASLHDRNRRTTRIAFCACGTKLSKPGYQQCRTCWLASRPNT